MLRGGRKTVERKRQRERFGGEVERGDRWPSVETLPKERKAVNRKIRRRWEGGGGFRRQQRKRGGRDRLNDG